MIKQRNEHTYQTVLDTLEKRLRERAPGRIQLVTGPRQVGKTTLLLAIQKTFGSRALYAPADGTESSLPGWWERLWQKINGMAERHRAILLIDEIQHVPEWSQRLKAEIDKIYREGRRVHIVVTGSSALHLGQGSIESLAGRFERLHLLHWPLIEMAQRLRRSVSFAADLFIRYGCYPGALKFLKDEDRWKAYVRDSIVEPAIGRDIMAMETIRKPALLRQIFAVCAGHPAEIVSLQKIRGLLHDRGALATVSHYLEVIEEASLVSPVRKYSDKVIRRRASPPKLIVLNNAILSSMGNSSPADRNDDPTRWGRWVENACIAHAWNAGQKIYYWREEPLEVDVLIDGNWGRWALEIKTGSFTTHELRGLLEFCRRHDSFRPIVLCDEEHVAIPRQAGVDAMPWRKFLAGEE